MKNLKDLSLNEKIGQLLLIGIKGYILSEEMKSMIKEYKFGNFILFAYIIKDLNQLENLTRDIHNEVIKSLGIIPFIAIDQEGGIVLRIKDKHTYYPGSMTLASTNISNAEKIGHMMGRDLLSLGINMNLAPVLDVNNNPKNPIIGIRSYSDNPEIVSKFGNSLIKGMQEEGIIATCKHFPGHGDVEMDSHLGLPKLNFDISRMDKIELKPFKDAINNGVKNIMTAHIIFKEIDNENPATLSENILKGILRNKLKYNGIITSDCMEMKAISEGITTSIGAMKGLKAGIDLVCISRSKDKQINSINEIKKAIDDNYINIEEIDEKVQRILKIKRQLYEVMNQKFFNNKENLNIFNDDNNCKIIQNIVDSSLTYVDGKKLELKGKILLYSCKPYIANIKEDSTKGDEENIIYLINKEIPSIYTIEYKKNEYSEELINKSKDYDTVIFVSFNAFSNPLQAKMINELNKICKNFFVISIRNPYDYLKIEKNVNFYTMYECTPNSIRTLVKFLKGEIEAIGKLPINLK